MDDIEIYTPKPDQFLDYKLLRLRATKEDPEGFWPPYETAFKMANEEWRTPIIDANSKNGRWILFAKLNSNLVGMISARKMDSIDGGVKIRDMFVGREARGKGIGKKLLQKMLDQLTKDNVKIVRLGVFTSQKPAFNLYKTLGFTLLKEEIEHFPDGLSHQAYIMEKKLA